MKVEGVKVKKAIEGIRKLGIVNIEPNGEYGTEGNFHARYEPIEQTRDLFSKAKVLTEKDYDMTHECTGVSQKPDGKWYVIWENDSAGYVEIALD